MYIHVLEYYLVIKTNDVLIHTITWMTLENMLCERSLSQKNVYMVPFICNTQYRQMYRDRK